MNIYFIFFKGIKILGRKMLTFSFDIKDKTCIYTLHTISIWKIEGLGMLKHRDEGTQMQNTDTGVQVSNADRFKLGNMEGWVDA